MRDCRCGCREVYPARLAHKGGWSPSSVPLPITPMEFDIQAHSFADGFGAALTRLTGRPVLVAVRNRCGTLDILMTGGAAERAGRHGCRGAHPASLWRSQVGPATARQVRFFATAGESSPHAMAAILRQATSRMTTVTRDHHMVVLPARMTMARFAQFCVTHEITASPLDALAMLAGKHNATTRMAARIWRARQNTALPALAQEGDGYGLAQAGWLEELTVPRGLAALYRSCPPVTAPDALLAAATERRSLLRGRAVTRLRKLPSQVRERFDVLLAQARTTAWLTEGHAPLMHARLPYALRGLLLRLGTRLSELSLLESAEDIFYLRANDLAPAPAPYWRIVERRREHTWPPQPAEDAPTVTADSPDDPFGDSHTAELMRCVFGHPPPRDGSSSLAGHPGAPGSAKGPACRVTRQADLAHVRAGDVVVAEDSGAAWSYAAPAAAAFVAVRGSPYGHLAALARDYNRPCAVGVTAAAGLRDGEVIEVNGDAGTISQKRMPRE